MRPVDSYRKNILGTENSDCVWERVSVCEEQHTHCAATWRGWSERASTFRGGRVQTQQCLKCGFLHADTTDVSGWIILPCGRCPVHCSMFSSIFGFYLIDASSSSFSPQLCQLEMSPDIANVLWGAQSHPVENHCFRPKGGLCYSAWFFYFSKTPLAPGLRIKWWEKRREQGSQGGNWQKSRRQGRVPGARLGWAGVGEQWSDLGYCGCWAMRICDRLKVGFTGMWACALSCRWDKGFW